MGLRIERDEDSGTITGVAVTPEPAEALSADDALLTVILDPSEENMLSGARHPDSRVRWAIALHPRLTVEVAEGLAADGDADVLSALASNPTTPVDVLASLGDARDLRVANAALRALVERLQEELQARGEE